MTKEGNDCSMNRMCDLRDVPSIGSVIMVCVTSLLGIELSFVHWCVCVCVYIYIYRV